MRNVSIRLNGSSELVFDVETETREALVDLLAQSVREQTTLVLSARGSTGEVVLVLNTRAIHAIEIGQPQPTTKPIH